MTKFLIETFLHSLKPIAKSGVLKLVSGNQSADMDSVCSAIAYAYFYHQKYPQEKPYIPLVNITKAELRLRRDIIQLLSFHHVTQDDLLFLDDLNLVSNIDLVLVDHCGLQGDVLKELYEQKRVKVTSIIDHHADEGVFLDASPRIVHSNGSCSSLVFNYWDGQIGVKEPELALFLLAPLVIDTTNMTQKVEEGDVVAFARYKSLLEEQAAEQEKAAQTENEPYGGPLLVFSAENEGFEAALKTFYTQLRLAKKDMSGFLVVDLLRKDYKLFQFTSKNGKPVRAGFSSMGKSFEWVLASYTLQQIVDGIEAVMKADKLDLVVLTISYTNKKTRQYTRELCYTSNIAEFENMGDYGGSLDLDTNIYNGAEIYAKVDELAKIRKFHLFNQANIKALRKQVVPAVKSIIEATSV